MVRIIACLTLLVLWTADASAQTRSSSGSGTSSGSSSSRSSSGSTGSTSRGSTSGSTGTTRGNSSSGSQGLTTDSVGSSEGVNRTFGNGLVGASDSAGTFIGNQQAGNQTLTNQAPNFQQRNSSSRLSSLSSRVKQVDVRGGIQLGFDIAPSGPRTFASAPLPQQVSLLTSRKKISDSIAVEMYEGGTAVITGTVPDAQHAKLLEMYMMLEPGVKSVENKTVVVAQ